MGRRENTEFVSLYLIYIMLGKMEGREGKGEERNMNREISWGFFILYLFFNFFLCTYDLLKKVREEGKIVVIPQHLNRLVYPINREESNQL